MRTGFCVAVRGPRVQQVFCGPGKLAAHPGWTVQAAVSLSTLGVVVMCGRASRPREHCALTQRHFRVTEVGCS